MTLEGLKEYQQVKSTEAFKYYVSGVGAGFVWANTALRLRKQDELYCQPEKLGLNAENYLDILGRQVQFEANNGLSNDEKPVELILLSGLIRARAFPCQTK